MDMEVYNQNPQQMMYNQPSQQPPQQYTMMDMPQQQQQQQQTPQQPQLLLPEMSTTNANEKALLWNHGPQHYGLDSGYTTQAPSIRSLDTAYMGNQLMRDETESLASTMTSSVIEQQPLTTLRAPGDPGSAPGEDPLANYMANPHLVDNDEMALRALPDILMYMADDEPYIVRHATSLLNEMSKKETLCATLLRTEAVHILVKLLTPEREMDTVRYASNALYNISSCGKQGISAILHAAALGPLLTMLQAPSVTIVSFALTTLHNILVSLTKNQVSYKNELRQRGAIPLMFGLIANNQSNVKLLAIAVDCIQLLAWGSAEQKLLILQSGGTQILVEIMRQSQYQKLTLMTSKLLKLLSACPQNKQALVDLGAVQVLGQHLSMKLMQQPQQSLLMQTCLVTIRAVSDAAVRLDDLGELIHNLLEIIMAQPIIVPNAPNSHSSSSAQQNPEQNNLSILAAQILVNLTALNENNKVAALQHNAIHILSQAIQLNLDKRQYLLVEPCVCTLRNITNKHSQAPLAQEQMRAINGLQLLPQLLTHQPRDWSVIKSALGLTRNFCLNQLNAKMLRECSIIEKLMQVLFDSFMAIRDHSFMATYKIGDVSMLDTLDQSASALLVLAKDAPNQDIMRALDCIPFFQHLFVVSNVPTIQRAGACLLAEVASNYECAALIDQLAGLHDFIRANFCNQYGALRTIAELNVEGSAAQNATVILHNVSTLVQRLDEYKARSRGPVPAPPPPPPPYHQQQPPPQQPLQQQPPRQFQQQQQLPPPMMPHAMYPQQEMPPQPPPQMMYQQAPAQPQNMMYQAPPNQDYQQQPIQNQHYF